MNYSEKLTWKRYQRLRRDYRAALLAAENLKQPCLQREIQLAGRLEAAQGRLDSFILTHILLANARRQGVDSTHE